MKNLSVLLFFIFIILNFNSCTKKIPADKINEIKELISAASKYEREDNYKTAVECYKKALDIKEDNNIRIRLGHDYLLTCQYKEAIETFKTVLKDKNNLSHEDYRYCMIGIGNAALELFQFEEAYNTYKQLENEIEVSELPKKEQIDFLSNIGKTEMKVEKYEDAANHIRAAMQVENKAYLHVGLSRALYLMGKVQEAIAECEYAVSAEDSVRTRVGLGESKAVAGDLQGALEEYKLALTKQSFRKSKEEIEYERNEVLQRIKETEEAIRNAQKQ